MNALELPEFNIIKTEGNAYDYLFTVETNSEPEICPKCQYMHLSDVPIVQGKPFKRHGVREHIVSDTITNMKRTKIKIMHKRWRCPNCNYTFYEILDCVDTNAKVTKRLYQYLQEESLKKTFKELANTFSVSDTTVKRAFDDHVAELEKGRVLKAPRVIGIDEAHLNKEMRGVITDIENRRILEMTETNAKWRIKETIMSMEGWKDIEYATMDMASGYRYAMKELVPNCLTIIDRFHVIKACNEALNQVRIDFKNSLTKEERIKLRNDRWLMLCNEEDLPIFDQRNKDKGKYIRSYVDSRDEIFQRFPTLETAYYLKEGLRAVYKAPDKHTAEVIYNAWVRCIPDNMPYFKALVETYRKCKKEILNYFVSETKYTNAYTESINNIIKRIEKDGMGYSYPVLRAKVLYGTIATEKPKWGEMNMYTIDRSIFSLNQERQLVTVPDYNNLIQGFGVDISTLLKVMDEGKF